MLETRKTARRSGRKREDRSYVECPDIVIEEDYLSKPSPAKRPNLNSSSPGGVGAGVIKPGNHVTNNGGTNGIAMESDQEDGDDEDDIEAEIPTPKVCNILVFFLISRWDYLDKKYLILIKGN